jgi:peptide/nickel transport system ATP-binding protein
MSAAPILSVRDLSIPLPRGGDRPFAVEGVSFDLAPSEILCIVGESGSGKSVLTSAILGALPPGLAVGGGRITLGGEDLSGLSEAAWRKVRGRRVALVPQEPIAALNPTLRVGRQIEEVFAVHGQHDRAGRRGEALRLIAEMRLPDPERIAAAYPHQLSGGQCQRICIAMAVALRPEVLIADEPTTALDVTTQAEVLRLVRGLRDRNGQSVLFITHDLGVVAEIADRVAVMQKGRLVEIGPASDVLGAPGHPYTRALLAAVPSLTPAPRPSRQRSSGPCLVIEGLTKFYGAVQALKPAHLVVERGTTLAIVGESGSGKSTLARLLVRLTDCSGGKALVNGDDLAKLSGGRLRRGRRVIQMVFQDPFGSLNPRRNIGPMIARAAELGGDGRGAATARAHDLLNRLGLGTDAYHRSPSAFSGGQRQRIGIARALALRPEVLIADESVSALDMPVQAEILALLRTLQAELGLTLVFITHDLRAAAQISDRIAVMRAGEIVEVGETAQLLGAPCHPYTQALLAAAPGRGVI